ncbi:hypothetical protein T06_9715 [Trichinella sp. T6]|nr:hypothetical protein T06_9715 [Trichinella sp. T6]
MEVQKIFVVQLMWIDCSCKSILSHIITECSKRIIVQRASHADAAQFFEKDLSTEYFVERRFVIFMKKLY